MRSGGAAGLKVVAIGDSLTYGYPYPPYYSWVQRVADRMGIILVNKGVCGETTADMRRRFARDVVAARPDWVIITGGSNDAFDGVATAEVVANVQAMADAALGHGIRPVIGLAPPMDLPEEELLAAYRQGLRELAAKGGLPVLDFCLPLVDKTGGGIRRGLYTDGVHLSEDGYALMAEAAVDALTDILT